MTADLIQNPGSWWILGHCKQKPNGKQVYYFLNYSGENRGLKPGGTWTELLWGDQEGGEKVVHRNGTFGSWKNNNHYMIEF